MRKYIIVSIISVILILACFIAFFDKKTDRLGLTSEEKEFINNNKNEIFFMGYYVTPSDRLIVEKLCAKISDDTGLSISPFEGSWEENLKLLQSGKLPMLANMNITEDRSKYTAFTSTLKEVPVGIYSSYDNKIASYEDIKDKTIGVENNVCLLEELKIKFPQIQFNEKYFNNLDKIKKALSSGEIDGFISSDSYSENLGFHHFFQIESLSKNNNHIGVNKNYPILYSIMKKEVDYLIYTGWDEQVGHLVNFDIEARLIELTDEEKGYIENKEVAIIGIPKDYSYYAYGDPYNPDGIIPELFKKIEIMTDLEATYIYDDYENLMNRDDIDIIIVSSEKMPLDVTSPIFFNNLIAVSNEKWNIINDNYELEPYKIGLVNDAVFIHNMKTIMPYIDMKIYRSYDELYQDLEKKKIDYAILPERVFEKKKSKANLVNNGVVRKNDHYIYSRNNDEPLINIINKCLLKIDVDALINEEVSKLIKNDKQFNEIFIVPIALFVIIGIMIQQIIKRKENIKKLLYFDEETMLHNKLWLKKKLKLKYTDYVYFLIQPRSLDLLKETYGKNAYRKALRVMITAIKDKVKDNEYIIMLQNNQILIIKNKMTDQNRMEYMNKLKTLFNRKLTILSINFSYNMHVASLKPEDGDYNCEKLLKELDIGLSYAKYTGDIVDYTYDVYCKYLDKINYDTQLSFAVINEEVFLDLNRIVDDKGQLYGYDVSCSTVIDEWGEVNFVNLKRSIKRLGLETIFDKIIFKKLFGSLMDGSYSNTKIFIEVNKNTLQSNSFFKWVKEKLESLKDIQLFIKTDMDSYEKLFETVDHINHSQLDFVLADFDQNLVDNTLIKDYEIPIIEINAGLFSDLEKNKEIIDFIVSFSRKNNKKILVTGIKTRYQHKVVKDYNIDYYMDDFRSDEDESTNSRG